MNIDAKLNEFGASAKRSII